MTKMKVQCHFALTHQIDCSLTSGTNPSGAIKQGSGSKPASRASGGPVTTMTTIKPALAETEFPYRHELNAFSKTLARRASIKGEVATSCSSEADCAAVQGPLTIRVAGVAPRVSAG
jgi:hypothetical protein